MARRRPCQPEVDPTFTMAPPEPCAIICWATCLDIRNWLFRVTFMTRSQSSSVTSRIVLLSDTATLLTRMSTRPKRATTALTSAATSSAFDTSVTNNSAVPAAFLSAAVVRSPRWRSRSTTATLAPSAANSCATASPILRPAPVTIATLSLSFMIGFPRHDLPHVGVPQCGRPGAIGQLDRACLHGGGSGGNNAGAGLAKRDRT